MAIESQLCAPDGAARFGRVVLSGGLAAATGILALAVFPALRLGLFAAGTAWLAERMVGAAVEQGGSVALMLVGGRWVEVSEACSGTDFFLMVGGLIGGRLARDGRAWACAALSGAVLAVPVTLLVNAVRVVVVVQAHRWIVPSLPERYGAFVHLAAGVAVFLPALMALNFSLTLYAKRPYASA